MSIRRIIGICIIACLCSAASGCSGAAVTGPGAGALPRSAVRDSIADSVTADANGPLLHNTWTKKLADPFPSNGLAVGAVNGILYAVGGAGAYYLNKLESYNPSTNRWTVLAPMPARRAYAAVGVHNGVLYVVGGSRFNISGSVYAYNVATNTWTQKASMPTPRYDLGVGFLNGILYAVGGVQRGPVTPTFGTIVEAYNPQTNTWTTKAPLPLPMEGPAVAVVNGVLYAIGSGGTADAAVEAYDPATDTWTAKAPMLEGKSLFGAAVVNGKIYAAAGCGEYPIPCYNNTLEAYDPAANTWAMLASMPVGVDAPGAGSVNGLFYVVGGQTGNFYNTGMLQAYRP